MINENLINYNEEKINLNYDIIKYKIIFFN